MISSGTKFTILVSLILRVISQDRMFALRVSNSHVMRSCRFPEGVKLMLPCRLRTLGTWVK
jgi:hypothetical protein